MSADILVLLWNCPDCTQLKMNFDFSKAFMDTIAGKNGNQLLVYYTFSNTGLKELLAKLDIEETNKAPLLIKSTGVVETNLPTMIDYMRANY